MAHIIFFVAGFAFGILLAANVILVAARILHNERLATGLVQIMSHVTWWFKMGGDGAQPRRRDAHIRV
jgi:hypothetical protein